MAHRLRANVPCSMLLSLAIGDAIVGIAALESFGTDVSVSCGGQG